MTKITGFEVGNSPYEYMTAGIADKTIILTTTDGTRALIKASKGKHVFAGSFLNVQAVAAALCELQRDVLLLCAGNQDEFALEDGLCAGCIIDELHVNPVLPSNLTISASFFIRRYPNVRRASRSWCRGLLAGGGLKS
ncbi:2-phosphosulfolactate phosphatase [Paenibacillus amylolyticus]|nr:2-phosphosulfolactate phosphatase [Paenibacillus amylolyticus]